MGKHVLNALLESGREIHVLVRSSKKTSKWLEKARVIEGDIGDYQSVRRAMDGCQEVIHMAALMKMWVKDKQRYEKVNLGGLKNAVLASKEVGIKKFLNISCFIALGPTDDQIVDENRCYRPNTFYNDYERSKWLADQYALELARKGFPIIQLYPGMLYGEGELTEGNLIGKIALAFLKGNTPGIISPSKRQCLSYISDVSHGLIRVLERGRIGERYILGGENITRRDLFRIFHEMTGMKMPKRVPAWPTKIRGMWNRWNAKILGWEPDITDDIVEIFAHDWAYSSERAIRELGYVITPIREGMKKMFQWLETAEL